MHQCAPHLNASYSCPISDRDCWHFLNSLPGCLSASNETRLCLKGFWTDSKEFAYLLMTTSRASFLRVIWNIPESTKYQAGTSCPKGQTFQYMSTSVAHAAVWPTGSTDCSQITECSAGTNENFSQESTLRAINSSLPDVTVLCVRDKVKDNTYAAC